MSNVHATSSAVELTAALRDNEISARELLDVYLDRIDRLDKGRVNAVVTLDAERARETAAAADERLAQGDPIGPLHGLPITIKDAIETEGIRSTGGAVELADHVPTADAPAVARLKEAGAIVFGKTNLPRWSGDSQAFNELFGTTNNPWSLEHVPGGSSGGSAAALAAGLTGAELGTDIGGSVRAPAHCCGIYALKPSYGVVPNLGYLDHVGGGTTQTDINTFGPMARSASDLDLLLGVLAGPAPDEAPAWRLELPTEDQTSLAGLRVAAWFEDDACPVDAEYAGMLRATADTLADAGARVTESHPSVPFGKHVNLYMRLIAAAVSPGMPDDFGEQISGTHRQWLRSDEKRAAFRRAWAEWFEQYDVLLAPAWSVPPLLHDQEGDMISRTILVNGIPQNHFDISLWLMLVNLTNLPSVVVPIGRTSAGLPVGMQIIAPYLRDRRAVRVAELVEELIGGYEVPPGFEDAHDRVGSTR
ncbi:MAG TPA: amidase family protein [Acidimicrobiia bacterium]